MKTHYDVLNLDKNCTAKEIKESFITLSKVYHPDKNKSSEAHKKFVEVNEAYSVLGKPSSRHSYDMSLSCIKPRVEYSYSTRQSTKTPYEEFHERYAYARRQQDMKNVYYTPRKLRAVFFCFILIALGSGLQMVSLSNKRALHSHHVAVLSKQFRERRQEFKHKEMKQANCKKELDIENEEQ